MSTNLSEQFQVTALIVLLSSEPNRNICVGGKNHEHCGRSAHVGKSGVLSCVNAVMGTPGESLKSVTTAYSQFGRAHIEAIDSYFGYLSKCSLRRSTQIAVDYCALTQSKLVGSFQRHSETMRTWSQQGRNSSNS